VRAKERPVAGAESLIENAAVTLNMSKFNNTSVSIQIVRLLIMNSKINRIVAEI
jgi:hypothetical protein